jgi:ABC-2 type transport system ATP-binding protein
MEQVEKLCDAICLIHKGRNVLSGTLPAVKAKFGSDRIQMRYDGKADFLEDRSIVAAADDYGKYVEIRPAAGTTPQDVLNRAVQQVTVRHFEITEPSLNEIFIRTVQSTGEEP